MLRRSSTGPEATSRPAWMIPTASHKPLDELELVAGEDDADSALYAFGQDVGERVDADRIQPREGFVEHQQLRIMDQRRRQLHPLLVAKGELLYPVQRPVGQAELGEQGVDRGGRRVTAVCRGAGRDRSAGS